MVVGDKWDHKAKIKYLKKHGLLQPRHKDEVRPKWSSKNTSATKALHAQILLQDSDDEDDALINDFYPQLGDTELTKEQKQKIKLQILQDLERRQNEPEAVVEPVEEIDGIYLGVAPDNEVTEVKLDEVKLGDYAKTRKVLAPKVSENLLEEYGITSYASTVRNTDYDDVKDSRIRLDKVDASQLDGFHIGQKKTEASNVRELTQEEREEELLRLTKADRAHLYNQIRKRFAPNAPQSKVLEIDNFNPEDQRLVEVLNSKLVKEEEQINDADFEKDLDELLGVLSSKQVKEKERDLDELLGELSVEEKPSSTEVKPKAKPATGEDFLDELLGL